MTQFSQGGLLIPPRQATISGTTDITDTGLCYGFYVVNSCVINTLTFDNDSNSAGYTGKTITSGLFVPGALSQIQLTSGIVVLFQNIPMKS